MESTAFTRWLHVWLGRPRPRNQTLAHEWTGLIARWEACRHESAAEDPIAARIDRLIEDRYRSAADPATAWDSLNLAEQLLARFLTPNQLKVEFDNLLGLAGERSLANLAVHQANTVLFDPPEEAARDAYLALLHDLQADHVQRRFRRALAGEAGHLLFRYGLILCLIAAAMLAVLAGGASWTVLKSNGFLLLLVAVAGCVGAYFSRTMTFLGEARAGTTSFDSFTGSYVGRMMRLRIAYGMIGAVVFYLLLKSEIIGGTAFPDLNQVLPLCEVKAEAIKDAKDAQACPLPKQLHLGKDLASLLVWSFLAGFSERLVPETLTRTEGRAADNKPGG